jgi:hypothetical protein
MGRLAMWMLWALIPLFVGVGLWALLQGKCTWAEFTAWVAVPVTAFLTYLQVRPDKNAGAVENNQGQDRPDGFE